MDCIRNMVQDDDDYYEDEEDEEGEGSDDEFVPSGNMSLSLMAALGLNTEGISIETDWKPPEVTGQKDNVLALWIQFLINVLGLTEDGRVRAGGGRGRDQVFRHINNFIIT